MDILEDAFRNKDKATIANYCLKEFGVEVPKYAMSQLVDAGHKFADQPRSRGGSWPDECWRCWVKNRIWQHFPIGGNANAANSLSVTLHVFFIHLEEDDLMLCRLRKKEPENEPEVATSKIFDNAGRVPSPVNATARRVARPPKNKKALNAKAGA